MCGIVGAVAERNVVPILLEGLKRLEYRGYDSAGLVVRTEQSELKRAREVGKVKVLEENLQLNPLIGHLGIAHTRWATHGKPTQKNAHPHICRNKVSLVHNGIIENHEELREAQSKLGFEFTSETDTEVIVHEVYHHIQSTKSLLAAVQKTVANLKGAFAIAVVDKDDAQKMVVARRGSPLVIGIGIGEHFIASDVAALLPVTNRFIFLEDGDIAEISKDNLQIYDGNGTAVERNIQVSNLTADAADKGPYRHFMLKEIYEQPRAIAETIESRIIGHRIPDETFGQGAGVIFDKVEAVQIIACGTSYHSGMVAKYWLEAIANIPCNVEIASEFRYRRPVVRKNSLVVTISQSGETADTLAALEEAKRLGFGYSLAICNVPESSLSRVSDITFLTRAGPEVGVASTKAFTTQLAALLMLAVVLGKRHGLTESAEAKIVQELTHLPAQIEELLTKIDPEIALLAESFADKHHSLFLGRGVMYPIAMEGALKLKEISYIHAEAYPAGELKHGPLALVDDDMPVITVAPNDDLVEKLKSNIQEVSARGGQLIVFADPAAEVLEDENTRVFKVINASEVVSPILFTIPLQLLSYHVAVLKGTDVDQPRNLAKSVTVE
ncbi:MAG: glutamine--fructose-6-phosphate transaminase (isomerizing) [Gammaproteobacteria bacterium]|nr:glutamine--fructose-6-phosphate transaminase (isomerizing) [Gammaproteobacteria bacterium]